MGVQPSSLHAFFGLGEGSWLRPTGFLERGGTVGIWNVGWQGCWHEPCGLYITRVWAVSIQSQGHSLWSLGSAWTPILLLVKSISSWDCIPGLRSILVISALRLAGDAVLPYGNKEVIHSLLWNSCEVNKHLLRRALFRLRASCCLKWRSLSFWVWLRVETVRCKVGSTGRLVSHLQWDILPGCCGNKERD